MSNDEDKHDIDLILGTDECQAYLDEIRQVLLGRTVVSIRFKNSGNCITIILCLDNDATFTVFRPDLDVESMRSQFELALEREHQRELAEQEAAKQAATKKTFIIGIREIHFRYYEVEAENEYQAKDLVNDRAPEARDLEFTEYAEELERDTWSVEEKPPARS